MRAITCVQGNVPVRHSYANAAHLLELLGRTDIPLAAGEERPLLGARRGEQLRWLAERDTWDRILAVAQPPYAEPRAVELILRTARESDGLTIIAIGPLTNVAAALVADPTWPIGSRASWSWAAPSRCRATSPRRPSSTSSWTLRRRRSCSSPACSPCSWGSTSATRRTSQPAARGRRPHRPNSDGSCSARAQPGCPPSDAADEEGPHLYDTLAVAGVFRPELVTLEAAFVQIETASERSRVPASRGFRVGRQRGRARTARTMRSWPPASTSPASKRWSPSAFSRNSKAAHVSNAALGAGCVRSQVIVG